MICNIKSNRCSCGGVIKERENQFELNDPPLSQWICEFCRLEYDTLPLCDGTVIEQTKDGARTACICNKCGYNHGRFAILNEAVRTAP